jgi:hypothetical protein
LSRKDEDRILHGLHYFRESIDQEFTVTSDQVLWLASHPYSYGPRWCKNGELQSVDSSVVPVELRGKLLMSKFDLPLRYLHYRRLIKLTRVDEDMVNLAVTFAGADRAMRLHTRFGRMELWYQDHKDGFLWLITTIAVSFITALVAVAVSERLHKTISGPQRVIYEVEPKVPTE